MLYQTLNNGVEMPMLGYGVFQTPPDQTERCVAEALEVGYRLIDTAQAYGNEEGVGAAVRTSSVPREDVFITSKIWVSDMTYERATASIDESLRKLDTDYIDLMLIHWPQGNDISTWRALQDACTERLASRRPAQLLATRSRKSSGPPTTRRSWIRWILTPISSSTGYRPPWIRILGAP